MHHSRETAGEKGDYETRRAGAPRPRRSPQVLLAAELCVLGGLLRARAP